ncbi:hypothetical protein PFISCL1PPCAC_7886, partial [Pristionchus fissidentatus]
RGARPRPMDAARLAKRSIGQIESSPPECGTGVGTPRSPSLVSDAASSSKEAEKGAEPATEWTESDKGAEPPVKRKASKLCPWENCETRVDKTDNAIFDHVVQDHILSLKGAEVMMKKEEDDEDDDDSDDEDSNPLRCRWPDCGKSLQRGEEDRKIEWLQEHLHSRHLPAAGRFRCSTVVGCTFRCANKKVMADHEKKCGKEPERKTREPRASPLLFYHPADVRPPQSRKKMKKRLEPAACFSYVHTRGPSRASLLADFDSKVNVGIKRALEFGKKSNGNIHRVLKPEFRAERGSQWRKKRLPASAYHWVTEESVVEAMEVEEETKVVNPKCDQTLDDLFPPPQPFPPFSSLTDHPHAETRDVHAMQADVRDSPKKAQFPLPKSGHPYLTTTTPSRPHTSFDPSSSAATPLARPQSVPVVLNYSTPLVSTVLSNSTPLNRPTTDRVTPPILYPYSPESISRDSEECVPGTSTVPLP